MEKQSQKQAVKFALRQMSVTLVKLNTLKGTGIDLTEFTDPLLSCIEDLICTFLSETEDQFENKLELIGSIQEPIFHLCHSYTIIAKNTM